MNLGCLVGFSLPRVIGFTTISCEMQPAPDDRIIDVGVSDVINSGANVIERRYRHQERITACGLGDGTAFRSAFPKVDYVRIAPSGRLPFADSAFAIATANAVLEHVGSDLQRSFVSELVRVGRRVFITVPNRYFPVEHHTALPFVHYFDATFRLGCSLTGNVEWTRPDNLILMTRSRLVDIAQVVGRPFKTGYTGLRCGPYRPISISRFEGLFSSSCSHSLRLDRC